MTAEVSLFELTRSLFADKIQEIYDDWKEGKIQSHEAMVLFAKIVGPLQEQRDMVEVLDKQVRFYAAEVVDFLGTAVEIQGFGKFEITRPTVSYTYDKKALDRLVGALRTEGLGDLAARIDECLKPSERAGTLRITREKSKE